MRQGARRAGLEGEGARAAAGGQTKVNQRLEALRKQLPQHPQGKDVRPSFCDDSSGPAQQHSLDPSAARAGARRRASAICTRWRSTARGKASSMRSFIFSMLCRFRVLFWTSAS